MMDESMYDLAFKFLDNGAIQLEQGTGCGETVLIDLHPCQLRLLAERAGLLDSSPLPTWPRGFERRLFRIRQEAVQLADFLGSIPSFPPRSEMDEDEAKAHALWERINDLLIDFGIDDDTTTARDADNLRTDCGHSEASASPSPAKSEPHQLPLEPTP